MVHRGGVKIKDFLENMTPLFNEIVIFKSEKFRFKKKKDLESFCRFCKFSTYRSLYDCHMPKYDKSYSWDCGLLKEVLNGFYDSYV